MQQQPKSIVYLLILKKTAHKMHLKQISLQILYYTIMKILYILKKNEECVQSSSKTQHLSRLTFEGQVAPLLADEPHSASSSSNNIATTNTTDEPTSNDDQLKQATTFSTIKTALRLSPAPSDHAIKRRFLKALKHRYFFNYFKYCTHDFHSAILLINAASNTIQESLKEELFKCVWKEATQRSFLFTESIRTARLSFIMNDPLTRPSNVFLMAQLDNFVNGKSTGGIPLNKRYSRCPNNITPIIRIVANFLEQQKLDLTPIGITPASTFFDAEIYGNDL